MDSSEDTGKDFSTLKTQGRTSAPSNPREGHQRLQTKGITQHLQLREGQLRLQQEKDLIAFIGVHSVDSGPKGKDTLAFIGVHSVDSEPNRGRPKRFQQGSSHQTGDHQGSFTITNCHRGKTVSFLNLRSWSKPNGQQSEIKEVEEIKTT